MKKLTFDELAKDLTKIADHTVDAIKLGQERVHFKIANVARARAPFRTGHLRRSGFSTHKHIAFGADYAATIHENPNSSGYKFLESAIKDASSAYADDVAKAASTDWTPDKPKRMPLRDFTSGDFDG